MEIVRDGKEVFDARQFQGLLDHIVVGEGNQGALLVIQIGDRSQGSIVFEVLHDDGILEGKSDEHDHSALGVSDVVDHLIGVVVDVLEGCR